MPKYLRATYHMLYGDACALLGGAERKKSRSQYDLAKSMLGDSFVSGCNSQAELTDKQLDQKIEIWRRIGKIELKSIHDYNEAQLERVVKKLLKFTASGREYDQIDARVFALYMYSQQRPMTWKRDWNHRNKISKFEGSVSQRIKDIGALTYEDVYAIHR